MVARGTMVDIGSGAKARAVFGPPNVGLLTGTMHRATQQTGVHGHFHLLRNDEFQWGVDDTKMPHVRRFNRRRPLLPRNIPGVKRLETDYGFALEDRLKISLRSVLI